MSDVNVLNYLNDQKRTNAECAAEWIEIESLFKDQSWKQLTEKIIALISHPAFRNEDCLILIFYRNFISTFQTKLDPYALINIVSVLTVIADKTKAIEILESIEKTVKGCNEAVWHCYVLKEQIQLNHLNDLIATKKTINTLGSALKNAPDVPVHWNRFLLATNYFDRVVNECNDNYCRLEKKLQAEKEKSKRLNTEVQRLNKEFEKQRKTLDKLYLVQTEIEAKFTTEAVRNFEEVINSQTEVSNLRKLNGRLLSELSQTRNQRNSLEDDKRKLEAKLETVITEQEQQKKEQEQQKKEREQQKKEQERQKQALMLMGALLDKLSLKNTNDDKSGPSNETGL